MAEADSISAAEVWKPIPGFEGFYEASSLGRIYSLARFVIRNHPHSGLPCLYPYPARMMKTRIARRYVRVCLSRDGIQKDYSVAHIVAEAFIGPRPAGLEVNHIDGNKNNNGVANLEYLTPAENILHAHRTGLCSHGERHHAATTTESQVREIRRLLAQHSGYGACASIARQLGVSRYVVLSVKHNHCWRDVG